MAASSCCEDVTKAIVLCVNFSAIKHSSQRRKDIQGTPYINHPIGTASILVEEGKVYDTAVIQAALLHDTVEDTETTFEEIEHCFGSRVRCIVEEVTDDKSLPKMERKRLQIASAPAKSKEARLVALADKLYNLRDLNISTPVGWSDARVHEYYEWAKKVVDGLRGTNLVLEQRLDELFEERGLLLDGTVE